jgi:hypothetical protein
MTAPFTAPFSVVALTYSADRFVQSPESVDHIT